MNGSGRFLRPHGLLTSSPRIDPSSPSGSIKLCSGPWNGKPPINKPARCKIIFEHCSLPLRLSKLIGPVNSPPSPARSIITYWGGLNDYRPHHHRHPWPACSLIPCSAWEPWLLPGSSRRHGPPSVQEKPDIELMSIGESPGKDRGGPSVPTNIKSFKFGRAGLLARLKSIALTFNLLDNVSVSFKLYLCYDNRMRPVLTSVSRL